MVLSEEYWFGMKFTKPELLALKCNFVQDNADGEIENLLSNQNPLPEDYYAIGTKCNSEHCFVYDSKYEQYENWEQFSVVVGAIMKMFHERIKSSDRISDFLL